MLIKAGIIGLGFIGASHIEAVRRIGSAQVLAVADANYELAKRKSEEYNIPRCYKSAEDLLADPEINVVHNCTPNDLHAQIIEKIIKAGKHVLTEKPLTRTSEESDRVLALLKEHPEIKGCVNFNYRMNPLVQEMKNKLKNGDIGKPYLVHGSYLQDWLLYETDYNWRLEPEICGPSRCVADIGSHWMDTVQTVLGSKIVEVCADLATVIPFRKKPKGQVETFSINIGNEYEIKKIETEDYGAVMFKMDDGTHGVFYVSEVSAGRGCGLNFEIDGSKASLYWDQETCDQMWMGFRDSDNLQIMRNPNNMTPEAKKYTYLAKGHPEGWNDAFKNNIYSFYKYISDGKIMGKDPCDFATFEDAAYIIKLTESILISNKTRQWVSVGGKI
jgi:predicted dehydrogenase